VDLVKRSDGSGQKRRAEFQQSLAEPVRGYGFLKRRDEIQQALVIGVGETWLHSWEGLEAIFDAIKNVRISLCVKHPAEIPERLSNP
jgi:hypothetical protein